MHTDSALEAFDPQFTGDVFRITNDWEKLIEYLPRFNSSATVYRSGQAIHCIAGKAPELSLVGNKVLYMSGFRGYTTHLDFWSEAWCYCERRHGQLYPCLEIANANGQGMFKVCFREHSLSDSDRALMKEITEEKEDAWSILHLHPANQMDCPSALKLPQKGIMRSIFSAIKKEAFLHEYEIGLILRCKQQSSWDSLPALAPTPYEWYSFGKGDDYITLLPESYDHAEVIEQGNRNIAVFYNHAGDPSLSIIEPEGQPLKSLRRLKKFLSSSDDWG